MGNAEIRLAYQSAGCFCEEKAVRQSLNSSYEFFRELSCTCKSVFTNTLERFHSHAISSIWRFPINKKTLPEKGIQKGCTGPICI